MQFSKLAEYLSELEKNSSRLEITRILADLFKKTDENEIGNICYLVLGQLAPVYQAVDFNLAEKTMIKVIAKASGSEEAVVKKEYKKVGDLGEVAQQLKLKAANLKIFGREEKKLAVNEVHSKLLEIARESGSGSVDRKIGKMIALTEDVDSLSVKYVVRMPIGKLRLGFSNMTILDALSWMVTGDKSLRKALEEAYEVRVDIGIIAQELKAQSTKLKTKEKDFVVKKITEDLIKIKPKLGTPILPALCQRLSNTEEMIEKMGKVAAEPKYDGTRLQIHCDKNDSEVNIFTRNLENVTLMFPDIVEALKKEINAQSVILDGEAIGYDPKTDKFLPFQETIKRKRKYDIEEMIGKIPLKYFCFDVMFLNGKGIIDKPFFERRKILAEILAKTNKTIMLSPQIITDDPVKLRQYHTLQKSEGLEGIVAKKLNSVYEPGRRGNHWVKLKEEKGKKGAGLADSLDCVVMGYNRGKGKRAGFGVGGFLVGIRNNKDEIVTITKIGTGLTDDQWRELKIRCDKFKTNEQPKEYLVDKNMAPDVWVDPQIVVEIEADNITVSPIHTAGLALRFPRLVKFRDDRSVHDASNIKEAKKLYQLQK